MGMITPWRSITPTNLRRRNIDDFFTNRMRRMFDFPDMEDDFQMPLINEKSSENKYQLEIAAPGFNKEDFDITVSDDYVIIRAENKSSEKENEEDYKRQEFSYQSFHQSFRIPENAIRDDIHANFKNGLLTLEFPLEKDKSGATKSKRITVA